MGQIPTGPCGNMEMLFHQFICTHKCFLGISVLALLWVMGSAY